MDPTSPDQAVASLLNGLNKGQYLILLEAVRQLGGEIRLDWEDIELAAGRPLPVLHVDASEGPVAIRIAQ